LDKALQRQKSVTADPFDPLTTLKEAIENLVKHGYTWVAISHVVMEMRSLFDDYAGQQYTNEIPEWAKPEWVGRKLRSLGIIDDAAETQRPRLFGKMQRVTQISERYVSDIGIKTNGTIKEVGPLHFCQGCSECGYKNFCEIQDYRKKHEAAMKAVAAAIAV
jgi:hypothetical protein